MAKDRIYPTNEEIERITRRLETLSTAQRELVREILRRLKSSGIGRQELHHELYRLRSRYALSDLDMAAVEEAFFPDEE